MTTALTIYIAIVAICINVVLTSVILQDVAAMLEDIASPRAARIFMRVCLIPPVGIVASMLWGASVIVGAAIMMILETWDR